MSTQVNVEVFVKLESPLPTDSLRCEVENELRGESVLPCSILKSFKNQLLTQHVSSIRICEIYVRTENSNCEVTKTTTFDEKTTFNTFFTRLSEEVPQSESIGGDDDTLAANFLPLPAKYLDGLWESLVYDSNIKQEILQYSKAMLHYSKSQVDPNIINCNRVLLLHGPPGTGKTSLCKAVAQKLSIRLNSSYSQALLIEINTHSLFSKYFSESGKLVSKMFGKIREIACDPQTLLCVLIDEVESLTHSRSASTNGSEPSDAIRVVNAVLTHLDILKSYPNILTLTTSNVTNAIDIAFVDRADLRVFIPNPSPFGIYSILYSCLEELIKKGLINSPCPPRITDKRELDSDESDGLASQMAKLCRSCEGLSGRALRKLPLRVHSTMLLPDVPASVEEFTKAMKKAAEDMKEEMKSFDSPNMIHAE
ncbi:hypothetical protein GE061_018158 [Apolygus lucorum]|uniref:AAA+ ATPase domain-containing protein n=1 Tax=Apolygus lucorum TaxID=248454 RepID=A0A6A4J8C1_APOLU|nr:hypothetical protein GE061_018158 [Apolygus lucorum]